MSRPYAIMLGQKKTGTTSFRHALDIAYRHIPGATANRDIRNRCKQLYSAGKYDKFIELTNRWNVVKDNPWNQGDMYKKLAEAYPKALFYLNIRDPDSWYRSKLGFGSESYDPNDPNNRWIPDRKSPSEIRTPVDPRPRAPVRLAEARTAAYFPSLVRR